MFKGIDLYSDTMTQPSPEMRRAIADAEVGNEQMGEDPTTLRLEEKVAELLGFTSAIFFPSATMANEASLRMHCEPGDQLIAAHQCHMFLYESGGPAAHAQVLAHPIVTKSGIFDGATLRDHYRAPMSPHFPIPKLVSVENTTNFGGGIPWPLDTLDSVVTTATELGLKLHLDGARLMNAAVKQKVPPSRLARGFHSATLCLSKGLGCPAGAVLALPRELYPRALRMKHLFGGAMRQTGILTAAGLYALEHNVQRLEQDHENAQRLAAGLGQIGPTIRVENPEPATNMVYFSVQHPRLKANQFLDRCTTSGLRFSVESLNRFRAVTHLGIQPSDIEKAVQIVRKICEE